MTTKQMIKEMIRNGVISSKQSKIILKDFSEKEIKKGYEENKDKYGRYWISIK